MFPLKKILCPTDFSEPSFEALEAANELALKFSADMILCHIVTPFPVLPTSGNLHALSSPDVLQEMINVAEEQLKKMAEVRVSKDISVKTVVIQGYPADEIVRMAKTENIDLIVIATHGLTGWRRFLFGSVTEKVVRLSTCPVLTIRRPEED